MNSFQQNVIKHKVGLLNLATELGKSLYMTLYIEGFSRFVTSASASIATGWSEGCRAGFAPAEKPCLCTAHKLKYASALHSAKNQWFNIILRVASCKPKDATNDSLIISGLQLVSVHKIPFRQTPPT